MAGVGGGGRRETTSTTQCYYAKSTWKEIVSCEVYQWLPGYHATRRTKTMSFSGFNPSPDGRERKGVDAKCLTPS